MDFHQSPLVYPCDHVTVLRAAVTNGDQQQLLHDRARILQGLTILQRRSFQMTFDVSERLIRCLAHPRQSSFSATPRRHRALIGSVALLLLNPQLHFEAP